MRTFVRSPPPNADSRRKLLRHILVACVIRTRTSALELMDGVVGGAPVRWFHGCSSMIISGF
eukprot:SAG31_NODE_175_length_21352_cov_3.981508_10_plen_62_part_00